MNEKREHFAQNTHFLQDFPLKKSCKNKYDFTFKSQDEFLPQQWKYSQACLCSKETKYLWSLVITVTLLCSLSKKARKLSISSVSLPPKATFVGNLEVPAWLIKHSHMIPYPGAFPYAYALINTGNWAKVDLIPLSQLWTLGSVFSLCAYFKHH